MARPPRSQRPRINKPSPLQQVHLTRPLSTLQLNSEMGLVRDPMFWKRFSTAVHQAEDVEMGDRSKDGRSKRSNSGTTMSTLESKYGCTDEWLQQQRREKRNCRLLCLGITAVVAIIIIAAAVVGWYFTHVHKL
ncbi:hypothetical protein G7Y89_g10189 [Cudoniella acicularis]|uniref:Uncharacterized protein n=1 Tax=Cudoniella acicularis TaxID=354080 RepID=A0A8H4RD83_9HELO|nr:hypothetical protein G7Y89_g10189 [Cudoniella acicularis]